MRTHATRTRRPARKARRAPDATRPLPAALQQTWGARLGHSLAAVRIHDGPDAGERARERGSVAFTVGRDVWLDRDRVTPDTARGRWALAHEVAHAAQQGFAPADEASVPTSTSATHEADAHRVAAAWTLGQPARPAVSAAPAAALLSPAAFQSGLGSTPQQRLAIDTLFASSPFIDIWNWLGTCTATPTQDQGPIALAITPGLSSGGTLLFGGYNPVGRLLEINPTKPEHVDNPSELVDTVVHEVIHAADDVRAPCVAAGSVAPPMGAAATSVLPTRAALAALPGGAALTLAANIAQGPSASDPCGRFIDINASAQALITGAIQANIAATGMGRPTLTFVNTIIRANPAAMTSWETCRTGACALAGAARDAALAVCIRDTIAAFLPPAQLSALLPAHILFATGSSALAADMVTKLDLVAQFLVFHPAQTVELVGHTDIVGSATSNVTLGQARADTIKAELLARGVPAGQIRGTSSLGETATRSTSTAERFRDRRVEILP